MHPPRRDSLPPQVERILRSAGEVVRRPRLFAMLDRGFARRVTLVSGPAGSGKTLLVASWLRGTAIPGPVAWISATATSGPQRFQAAVVERLATTPPLLVLDDLRRLPQEALDGLAQAVAGGPPEVRAILITRGRLRARLPSDRCEIAGADLAFTTQETAAYLTAAGRDLPDDELVDLYRRTEGWAMALRAAVTAPGDLASSLADYVAREVLAEQSPAARRVLSRTCVLERVNGSLADRLSGRSGGERVLRGLEDADALVHALDPGRSWFRYHPLLTAVLRLRLRREAPGELERLHCIAAHWHAQHGFAAAAIRHARMGRDWAHAGELVKAHWLGLLLEGEQATVTALLEALPGRLVRADAELAALVAAGRTFAVAHDAGAWLSLAREPAMGADDETAPRPVPVHELPEPPTERELSVLRLLPTHLTADEIAQELLISPNTVKSHMRSLYRKLGVHRRGDAVERAGRLGLLPSTRYGG